MLEEEVAILENGAVGFQLHYISRQVLGKLKGSLGGIVAMGLWVSFKWWVVADGDKRQVTMMDMRYPGFVNFDFFFNLETNTRN